jgi:hypothetical protein
MTAISEPSSEVPPELSKFRLRSKTCDDNTTPKEDNYNEIFEINIPKVVVSLVKEFKGEEIVRLELSEMYWHYRRERREKQMIEQTGLSPKLVQLMDQETNRHFVINSAYFLGRISINYYNFNKLKFEPFIDPWNFELNHLQIKK